MRVLVTARGHSAVFRYEAEPGERWETVLSAYEEAYNVAPHRCQVGVGENKVLPSDLVSSSGTTGLVLVIADTEASAQLIHLGDQLRAKVVGQYESAEQSFEALCTNQKIGQELFMRRKGLGPD